MDPMPSHTLSRQLDLGFRAAVPASAAPDEPGLPPTWVDAAAHEITSGLCAPRARISPKYFYDRLGSRLFEAITELPEYYPTRTERGILVRSGAEIALATGRGAAVIDLGAGNCAKAASLFPVLEPRQYVGVDISAEFVAESIESLVRSWPALDAFALAADLTTVFELPSRVDQEGRLFTFFGSSIGNFDPLEARALLGRIRRLCGETGGLLIGIDLVKDRQEIEAAYNDALGVTAAFNRNALLHVNARIGSDFDIRDWQHRAFFVESHSRIEMHLEARRDLVVTWPGGSRAFSRGERIHTENSHKYRLPVFEASLADCGFRFVRTFTDDAARFALVYAGT